MTLVERARAAWAAESFPGEDPQVAEAEGVRRAREAMTAILGDGWDDGGASVSHLTSSSGLVEVDGLTFAAGRYRPGHFFVLMRCPSGQVGIYELADVGAALRRFPALAKDPLA